MRAIKIQKILLMTVLIIGAVIYLGPFIFSVIVSFSDNKNLINQPGLITKSGWTLKNYVYIWKDLPFSKWLFNSVLITVVQTITNVFFSALAGFTFAKLEFRGKNLIFGAMMASLMIPGIILIIPKFMLINELRMINSYPGLILPGMVSVVNIFLMKQFFETMPKDLEKAALIDGCNYFQMFWKVFIPNSKPALAAVAIYTFQGTWNEFLWPLIATNTGEMFTLPVGMASLRYELLTDWPAIMAGTILVSIPTLLIFIVFQRFFVQGIASTGGKE
jgi:multiple sugar transport system permease protein